MNNYCMNETSDGHEVDVGREWSNVLDIVIKHSTARQDL